MLRIRNLSKKINGLTIIDNITFSVAKGEIFGILGPSAAGKTTIAKMLAGLLLPTSGIVELDEKNLNQDTVLTKKVIGYLPAGCAFYPEMKVIDFLRFMVEIRGINKTAIYQSLANIVKKIQLEQILEKRIKNLSRGQHCKVAIAQALIHDPMILILDEPTVGLDPNQEHEIRKLIKVLGKDRCVIIASKSISDIEELCDRVAVIAAGKIIIESTPAALAQQSPFHNAIQMRLARTSLCENVLEVLRDLQEIERIERVDSKKDEINLRIYPADKQIPLAKLNHLAEKFGWEILDLQVIVGRLEEVFRTITTKYQQVM